MSTVQLLPKEADVITAFPDEGAVLVAHLALATQRTPRDIETDLKSLESKRLIEWTDDGLVRLTPLGSGTRRVLARGGTQPARAPEAVTGVPGTTAAAATPTPPESGSGWGAGVVVGAVTGAAIGGPIGGVLGGVVGAVSGVAVGGTLGNLVGRQFESRPATPRVELLPEPAAPTRTW